MCCIHWRLKAYFPTFSLLAIPWIMGTSWQFDRLTCWPVNLFTSWPVHRLTCWRVDLLTSWMPHILQLAKNIHPQVQAKRNTGILRWPKKIHICHFRYRYILRLQWKIYTIPVSRAPADGAGSTFSLSKLGLGKSGAVENFLTGATETAGPLNYLKNNFPDLDFWLWILFLYIPSSADSSSMIRIRILTLISITDLWKNVNVVKPQLLYGLRAQFLSPWQLCSVCRMVFTAFSLKGTGT